MNFGNWFKSLVNPAEVFREEKKNADLFEAIKNVGVAGSAAGVVYALIFGVFLFFFANMMEGIIGVKADIGIALVLTIITIIILYPIFTIIGFLIASGFLFISAKIFGGKGSFTTQTYLISLPYAALILIEVVLGILNMIPFIGFLFSLLSLLVFIYLLSPLTIALKETHNYSTIRAVLTWLLPGIIIMILFVILIILFILPIFSELMSQTYPPTYY